MSNQDNLYVQACEERDEARAHLADLEALFDLRHRADMRAIERWRAGHPERALTLPDHVDLVTWLGEQLDAALVREAVLREAIDKYLPSDSDEGDVDKLRASLANLDPLAAAVGRVVGAAKLFTERAEKKERDDPYGDGIGTADDINAVGYALTDIRSAVDALRALAPWWPS